MFYFEASDVANATNNTNTGIPREYVVDMNDKLLELLHKGM